LADPRVTIAGREFRVLAREKTIVLALLIQLFIAAFSSFLVVGLVSIYSPDGVGGVEVDVAVSGDDAADLLAAARDSRSVDARAYGSHGAAMDAFRDGRVDAVVETERDGDGGVVVSATVPDENIRTTVTVSQLRELLLAYEAAERTDRAAYLDVEPLELPPRSPTSPYFGFTYTVLVPLLLFLPVFISGSVAVDSVSEEYERGTLELLRVAPVSMTDIVDGKLLATATLAPAQAALWLGLLRFNGTAVADIPLLLALVAGLAVAVCGLGVATALTAGDRRAAQTLFSMAALALFGGATLFGANPAALAARVAVGSADAGDALAVGGYVLLGVVVYAAVRALVTRADPPGA
jgi:ABC-type Na+ efflux pump permease subunit